MLSTVSLFSEPRVLVHGHRGARAMRPENTLPAFEYAISLGVDVLELDMAVTKDNVLVVSHDPRLSAKICKGPRPDAPIRELTLEEVQQYDCGSIRHPDFPNQQVVPGTHVPTLEDVFALAGRGNFEFNVETKISPKTPELAPPPDQFARLVVDAIHKHNLEKRVIVQSFDYRTLQEVKKIAPGIRLSALTSGPPRDWVQLAKEAGANIVSPEFVQVTEARVRAAHAAGLQVIPWTPNTRPEWKKLTGFGVDAIITDDPGELISFLRKPNSL